MSSQRMKKEGKEGGKDEERMRKKVSLGREETQVKEITVIGSISMEGEGDACLILNQTSPNSHTRKVFDTSHFQTLSLSNFFTFKLSQRFFQ